VARARRDFNDFTPDGVFTRDARLVNLAERTGHDPRPHHRPESIPHCSSEPTNQEPQATGGAAAAPATGGVARP